MKKLKIGIIGQLTFPFIEPFKGGIEVFTHTLAKLLIERGHEVVVFATKGTDQSINPYIVGKHTDSFIRDDVYNKIMNDILPNSDFDIIHNNSVSRVPIKFSNKLPMPMVTTLHSASFDDYGVHHADNNNNTYVTISNYMHNKWFNLVQNNMIYNGVNLEKFVPLINKSKENYAIWFGRITPEKGTIYAIEAAKMAGIQLKIAGPIFNYEYFKKTIKPKFKSFLFKKNVKYLGHLSHVELQNSIAKAKATIFIPEPNETYGFAIAESLACGTPVAAFNTGPASDLLNEKSGVLALPNNIKSLSEALKKTILLNPKDCRKRAYEIGDINTMVDKYEKLYYKLHAAKSYSSTIKSIAPKANVI